MDGKGLHIKSGGTNIVMKDKDVDNAEITMKLKPMELCVELAREFELNADKNFVAQIPHSIDLRLPPLG